MLKISNAIRTALTVAVVSQLLLGSSAINAAGGTAIYPAGSNPIAPYSPAVKLSNGVLFVSGQIPYVKGAIPAYARDGHDDMTDQSKIVMNNLEIILKEAGYSFDDAVKVSVFMSDINNYGAFNKVYGTYWGGDSKPPAREAVEIGALPGGKPNAEVLVEVSMILAK